MTRISSWIIYSAFFLSGMASLICEVVWFKWFGLAVGNTTFSASVVVTSFFVGLGLGAILVGPWADRARRPLLVFASRLAPLAKIAACLSRKRLHMLKQGDFRG